MQIKFLKLIIEHLAGKQAVPIVDLLATKKDVNEFLIAKKLDLTINQTRNILYRLSDFGLVSFIRKKDKRKGWYIYFWTLNVHESLNLLWKKLNQELSQLNSQLKCRKEKRYYNCNTCCVEVTEEVALLNNFTCPECEEVYELSENEKIIKKIERGISKLEREIKFVSEERDKEGEKIQKKKAKKIKKAEKERVEARIKKRALMKKLRDAVKKKEGKKVKKKVVKKKSAKKKAKQIKKKVVKKKIKKKVVKKVSKLIGKLKKKAKKK